MEAESSVLPTIDVETKDQIVHSSHVHPLTLYENDYRNCCICLQTCLGRRTYGCIECGFFLHEPCAEIEIPQEIDHYFHLHPLKLAMTNRGCFDCVACLKTLAFFMFECHDCRFYMDVACASFPTILKQNGWIDPLQHFKHTHPLILCDDEKIITITNDLCSGCKGELSTRPRFSYDDTSLLSEGSESIYGCLHWQCTYFLHERCCAPSTPKIDSPLHPGHSLELFWLFDHFYCHGCGRPPENQFAYQCIDSWKFILCEECALLRPLILKFDSHDHLLSLFPRVSQYLRSSCKICNEKCDTSNIFRCIDCDYNLHFRCGPLPSSIKDKCHEDPLKLMYDFVEDGYEDDVVYCDVCEQPRDPDECVYYCKDCNFFAEVKCVEAEVLRSLKGERGNVKLRTANKTRIRVDAKLISYVITDNAEIDSDNEIEDAKYLEVNLNEKLFSGCSSDEDYEQLVEIFSKARVQFLPRFWPRQEIIDSSEAFRAHIERCQRVVAKLESQGETVAMDNRKWDKSLNKITGLLSHDFKHLMRNLDSYYEKYNSELGDAFFRRDYNIVRIGEHKIAQDSASVLKGLLHKYGDFTAKSKLNERLKAIFLTMFCEVIHTMCFAKVKEVDQETLRKWWK